MAFYSIRVFPKVALSFSFFILLSLVIFSGGNAGEPIDFQKACKAMAEKIADLPVAGKTVAVRPFVSVDRQWTLLGSRLQDGVTIALAGLKKRSFQVIERARLHDLDIEKTAYGGADDLEGWTSGLKADLVVLGSYTFDKSSLKLEWRIVEPSGKVLGSGYASGVEDSNIRKWAATQAPATPMMAAVESVARSDAGLSKGSDSRVALFVMEKGRPMGFPPREPIQLKVGDKIGFSVRPPMDSRLYVINFDPQSSEDSVIFLHPLPQFGAKVFNRNATYDFPRSVDPNALSYPVDPPAGRMVFKVIGVDASQERVDLSRGLSSLQGYYQMDPDGLKVFLRELASLPPSAWWEETIEFWIAE